MNKWLFQYHDFQKIITKTFLLLGVLVMFFSNAQEKEFHLIDVVTHQKKVVKDSISAVRFLDSLAQSAYFLTKIKKVQKKGKIVEIEFDKGIDYHQAQIYFSNDIQRDLELPKTLFTKNLDSLKKKINQFYIDKGFAFNRVQTKVVRIENNIPQLQISVKKLNQRTIDKLVFKGYKKLPKRFIKNIENEFVGKVYHPQNIEKLHQNFQNHPFIQLTKVPQTLFRKDSTQVFLFSKKKKANSFDGIIGFGNNDKDKIAFNGTLNLIFNNLFNGFEKIQVYWQRNPDKGQTFNLDTDIPYLFKTNIGTENSLHIYRQDTLFANVKLIPSLYYRLNFRQKIGVRGIFESSTVLDETYTQADDFTKRGIGLTYEYQKPTEISLFIHQTLIRLSADIITTKYDFKNTSNTQQNYAVYLEHNLPLYRNHYLNLKGEGTLMNTKNPLSQNEKLRFGGWNSLRGFNENSLLADSYFYGNLEYRYLINQDAFFDAFGQYGQLQNKNLVKNPQLYSFGFGFHFRLPIGLMSLQISNGSQFSQAIQFKQTKIHWGILSRF